MGYLAITSSSSRIQIKKTSETIFIKKSRNYVFFEMEVCSNSDDDYFTEEDFIINIYLPGKIKNIGDARYVLEDTAFLPWYYSQKKIDVSNNDTGHRFTLNGEPTRIVKGNPLIEYNRASNVSSILLRPEFCSNESAPVKSIHLFFSFWEPAQTVSHRGTLISESRYFDRKLCPIGTNFINSVLSGNICKVKNIYCWFVLPQGYMAIDYSNFDNTNPKDARIIEKEYNVLLNGLSFPSRLFIKLKDKLKGRPQVIRWNIRERQITYNESLEDPGKWDEIRLFISSTSYPLWGTFIFVATTASIISLAMYIFSSIFMGSK